MFSPGSLNAQAGTTLGGVSSHAEIGGECGLCHTAPWDSAVSTMINIYGVERTTKQSDSILGAWDAKSMRFPKNETTWNIN